MKSSEPLNWAVVGLGVGEQHARRLAALPNCRLCRLHDQDHAKAVALAAELGAAVAPSYEAILDDLTLDAVVIASFDDDHYAHVIAALEAAKHVFVEKPLCRTLDELRHIKRVWKRSGRALSSNLILRAAPLYRWLKAQREQGVLGQVYAFDGEYLFGRLWKLTEGWRKDVENYSVMEGGGVHLIDLMLWLTGERPDAVFAAGNRITTQDTAFRYDDFTAATYCFPSGLVGRIVANFGCVHRHHHVLRMYGTAATFLYDDAGPRLHTARDPALKAAPVALAPLPAHKGDLLPGFVSSILTGADLVAHTQTLLDGISLAAAADRAAQTGERVRIEYV